MNLPTECIWNALANLGDEFPHQNKEKCLYQYMFDKPIPAAARSKAWVCDRSLAGIVGSYPAGSMDVCLL